MKDQINEIEVLGINIPVVYDDISNSILCVLDTDKHQSDFLSKIDMNGICLSCIPKSFLIKNAKYQKNLIVSNKSEGTYYLYIDGEFRGEENAMQKAIHDEVVKIFSNDDTIHNICVNNIPDAVIYIGYTNNMMEKLRKILKM